MFGRDADIDAWYTQQVSKCDPQKRQALRRIIMKSVKTSIMLFLSVLIMAPATCVSVSAVTWGVFEEVDSVADETEVVVVGAAACAAR